MDVKRAMAKSLCFYLFIFLSLSAIFILVLLSGCKYCPKRVNVEPLKFSCSSYFSQEELDCMDEVARKSKSSGMTREEARYWIKGHCYRHDHLFFVEQTFCLDDVLDRYYKKGNHP